MKFLSFAIFALFLVFALLPSEALGSYGYGYQQCKGRKLTICLDDLCCDQQCNGGGPRPPGCDGTCYMNCVGGCNGATSCTAACATACGC